MGEPSTDWREVVLPEEKERHERQAAQFAEMQSRKSEKYGAGRALHRRQLAALRARLDVPGDLPEYAKQGIFAIPNRYDAWIRLSNGGFSRAPDAVPDIRGFAIKVLGVRGPAALGGEAVSQDFALINHERFSSATSDDFTKVVTTGAGTRGQILLKLLKNPGMIPELKTVTAALKSPFSGFATQDFFSAAPIAFGPYAVRVRLVAASSEVNQNAKDDWAGDVYERLIDNPLVRELQVQFFTDEATTPIEDASVVWPAPYLTVARLTIPRQKPDPAFDEEIETAKFDPWNALTAHRPLGEVMRARKVAYFASQQNRSAQ
ncbi:catalase family protein [Kribbella alba]|uniref:Catalase family protein n=1 Tax=Kribbella alba TaxID=190197 RepID=A0ABN2F8K8_9ACTN